MPKPNRITPPPTPRFLFTPNQATHELYITCSSPLALIWVRQTIPAQLYILEGPQDEQLLRDAADWYRKAAVKNLDAN